MVLQGLWATLVASATAGCIFGTSGGNGIKMESVESFASFAATQSSEFSEEQTDLVDTALREEDYVTYGNRPFPDGSYVEVDGTFHHGTVTHSGTKQMTRPVLGADHVPGEAGDVVPTKPTQKPTANRS